jgi:hypothetical protein
MQSRVNVGEWAQFVFEKLNNWRTTWTFDLDGDGNPDVQLRDKLCDCSHAVGQVLVRSKVGSPWCVVESTVERDPVMNVKPPECEQPDAGGARHAGREVGAADGGILSSPRLFWRPSP